MPPDKALDPTRSFEVAWRLLKQAPVTVLLGGLILFFLEGGGSGGLNLISRGHDLSEMGRSGSDFRRVFQELRPYLLILIPIVVCISIAFFALSSWIEVGFARAVEFSLRTGKDEVVKVFSGGDRLGAMLLARFLCGLIHVAAVIPIMAVVLALLLIMDGGGPTWLLVTAVALLSAVISIYLAIGLFFVNPIVAFESCSPTEAISRSWKMAGGRRLRILWFFIFQFFLGIAGLCLCCIGLLLTTPLSNVMRFEVYLALTKGGEYPQWWIGSGKFPFDEPKAESYGSPPVPPPLPPPLPPQA
jgi:hypothetical protein